MIRRSILGTILLLLGACTPGVDGSGSVGAENGDVAATTVPGSQLLGKVTDPDGMPVPRATVTVGSDVAVTAPDGWFDLLTTPGDLHVAKPAWVGTDSAWDGSDGFTRLAIEPRRIRALRVGAEAAGDDERFAAMLTLADETAINAFVFDTKQEGGKVFYETEVAEAHDSGAVVNVYDPVERIAQAKEHGLYTITRIVTFEDSYRAEFRPEEAYDGKWINPTNPAAWEYPIALGEEACRLGFDEVQFDYVRFPSEDAAQISGQLEMTEEERTAVIEGFLREARKRVNAAGCAVSADVFAIVVSASNDQGIGQRPEELTRHLDAFSPMVYPSH
ncbi:MAG TPA: putative glycoside hydrolase, partial [Acidimicrobiia bacterium]|nr:putative glycoside hydrolase [Acidimicrobiia bacterium]